MVPVKTTCVHRHGQLVKVEGPKHARATVKDSPRHPEPGCHRYLCLAEKGDSGNHSDSLRCHQSHYARRVFVLGEPC